MALLGPVLLGNVERSLGAMVGRADGIGMTSRAVGSWSIDWTANGTSELTVSTAGSEGNYVGGQDIATDGTNILCVRFSASGGLVRERLFTWSSKTWGTEGTVNAPATPVLTTNDPHIVWRASNSDYVVSHEGNSEKVHGTNYARVAISYGTPGSWTTVQHTVGTGQQGDWHQDSIVINNDGQCHVSTALSTQRQQWAFFIGNTIDSIPDVSLSGPAANGSIFAGSWAKITDTAEYIVASQGSSTTVVAQAESRVSGTDWTGPPTVASAARWLACAEFDGVLWAIGVDATANEIQFRISTDGGVTWSSSDLTLFTGAELLGQTLVNDLGIRAVAWTISGQPVLSIVYEQSAAANNYIATFTLNAEPDQGTITLTGQQPFISLPAYVEEVVSTGTDSSTAPVILPASITAGDIVIVAFAVNNETNSIVWDHGSLLGNWTQLDQTRQAGATGQGFTAELWAILADGSEAGGQLDISTGSSESWVAIAWNLRISEGFQSLDYLEIAYQTGGPTTDQDYPQLVDSLTGDVRRYLALAVREQDVNLDVPNVPSGYTAGADALEVPPGGVVLSLNHRHERDSDADEHPGTTTETESQYWGSWTIAVSPLETVGAVSIPVGPGAITLTGLLPIAITPKSFSPAAGTIALTGLAPAFDAGFGLDVGAISLTGQAPEFDTGFGIPAAALALTGLAPSLEFEFRLAVDPGVIALTGLAPTVSEGVVIPVAVGAIALTGEAPAADFGFGIPVGAIALTGLAPVVEELHFIATPAGTIVLTGELPIRSIGVVIPVPVGAIALTGEATSADFGFGIPAGTIALTGQLPIASRNIEVAVPAGAIVLTGLAPMAEESFAFAVGSGTIALTGEVPTLEYGYGTPAGSISLTGLAPSAEISYAIEIAAGTIALTGLAPVISIGEIIPVDAGAIALTGLAPSADISYFIEVPAGTIALTGLAPEVSRSIEVGVPAGIIALTGAAPSADISYFIEVPAGSISLIGQAPQAVEGVAISVDSGAIALVGQAPAADFGFGIPAGAIALTGLQPEITGDVILDPGAGSIILTGLAPSLGISYAIEIPAGAIALSGAAPSMGLEFAVDPATIALTGLAPSAELTYFIATPAGALALSGEAPAFDLGIAAGVGSLSLTGQLPTVDESGGAAIAVPAGSISLTGQTPVRFTGRGFPVPAGSLALTGLAPAIGEDHGIAVAAGSISLSGAAPQLGEDHAIAVPSGSLALTGEAPAALLAVAFAVPAGSLALSGAAPAIGVDYAIAVQAGTIILSGQAPTAATIGQVSPGAGSITLQGYAPQAVVSQIGGEAGGGSMPFVMALPISRALKALRQRQEFTYIGSGGIGIGGAAQVEFTPAPALAATVLADAQVSVGGAARVQFVSSSEVMLLLMAA